MHNGVRETGKKKKKRMNKENRFCFFNINFLTCIPIQWLMHQVKYTLYVTLWGQKFREQYRNKQDRLIAGLIPFHHNPYDL